MSSDAGAQVDVRALVARYEAAFQRGTATDFEDLFTAGGAFISADRTASEIRTFVLADVASMWPKTTDSAVRVVDVDVHIHDHRSASVDLLFDHPEQRFHDHLVLAREVDGQWRIIAKISTTVDAA